ncbi:hypothetical protein DICA1_A02190 [Diutina catenulata]
MGRPRKDACTNCRRLRIKCDEVRPACEYCVATRKQCVYQSDANRAPLPTPQDEPETIPRLNSAETLPSYLEPAPTTFSQPSSEFYHHAQEHFRNQLMEENLTQAANAMQGLDLEAPGAQHSLEGMTLQSGISNILSEAGVSPRTFAMDNSMVYELVDGEVAVVRNEFNDIEPPEHQKEWPLVRIWNRLNSPTRQLNISTFELKMLSYLNEWTYRQYHDSLDVEQVAVWNTVMSELFFSSELVRHSLFAYAGMIILQEYAPNLLIDDGSEASTALVSVRDYSTQLFSYQLQRLGEITVKLSQGEASGHDAATNVVSSALMFSIVGAHPSMMPLVDHNGRDFIHLIRGMGESLQLCYPILKDTYMRLFFENDVVDTSGIPNLPFFQQILRYLEFTPPEEEVRECLELCIYLMDRQLFECYTKRAEIPFYRFLLQTPEPFWDLVYRREPWALAIANVYSSYALMFKFYFHRQHNMWSGFMRSYKSDGHNWLGPWEADLYELVVEKHYEFPDARHILAFDPYVMNKTH